MELLAGRERRNRHSQPHPTAGCWGGNNAPSPIYPIMPPQAQGWEFQMQSVPTTPMGTGILWYVMEDELFLTHPGLGCAGEGAGSIPTTHSSYILGHNPLPLWPHMPEMVGAISLPHRVIHSSSSLPPQHWWSGLKPVCPPPPHLGGFCTPQTGSCGSFTPSPPGPLVGLCPGFIACAPVSTLLGQAQLGSGGL